MPKKNPKPLTVLVEERYRGLLDPWSEKGHTIIVLDYLLEELGGRTEIDGIVSPNAKVLNPKSTFLSVEKQLVVIEKALRAVKYPVKKKGK